MKQQHTETKKLYVWNLFIRFFHFNLIIGMVVEYISIEFNYITLHVYAGYYLAALLFIRILYLFVDRPHTGYKAFKFRISEFINYLISILRWTPDKHHYVGHNPAGSFMIIALLISLFLVIFSGMAVFAYIDYSGPLGSFSILLKNGYSGLFREAHELMFDGIMILIGFHILGVIVSSIKHKINLPLSIVTGYKTIPVNPKTKKK